MVKRIARPRVLIFILAGLLAFSSAATAEPLLADPSVVVSSPADFRLKQALFGATANLQHQGVANGLHGSAAAEQRHQGLLPNTILQLDPQVQHVLLADLREHRLYLLQNGDQPRVLRQMYATIGKNGSGKQIQDDGRTPVGIYTVTRELKDSSLPELYGSGAFPLDYPNRWDRWHRRTGYGIWVHGVPRANYSRAPQSSEGCVAVANEDLDSLKPFMQPGNTRVIFSDQVEWLDPTTLARQREVFSGRLQAWRQAWESLDTPAYLRFYSDDFSTPDMSRQQFVEHKLNVNSSKAFIKLQLEQVNMFNYPDGEHIRLVEFTQHYESDNYRSVDRKQQYWQRADDGQWYILREATIDS